jgi:hypothetical protein
VVHAAAVAVVPVVAARVEESKGLARFRL